MVILVHLSGTGVTIMCAGAAFFGLAFFAAKNKKLTTVSEFGRDTVGAAVALALVCVIGSHFLRAVLQLEYRDVDECPHWTIQWMFWLLFSFCAIATFGFLLGILVWMGVEPGTSTEGKWATGAIGVVIAGTILFGIATFVICKMPPQFYT